MQKAEKPSLTRAIVDCVSNAPVICEEMQQAALDDDSILQLTLPEENFRCKDVRHKRISYFISNFSGASVVFDGYPAALVTNDNTHK